MFGICIEWTTADLQLLFPFSVRSHSSLFTYFYTHFDKMTSLVYSCGFVLARDLLLDLFLELCIYLILTSNTHDLSIQLSSLPLYIFVNLCTNPWPRIVHQFIKQSVIMDARLRRVNKEIADCKNDKTSNITLELIDDSPFHLKGSFPGPEDTAYEGGHFEVDIQIPPSYPFQPVKMKFITKVYHPNVSSASGAICLDILKDAWSPVLTLKSTLISLQSLLCSPEPNDPQDAEVAKHYTTSKESWEETAAYWTQIYAGGPGPKGRKADKAKDDKAGKGKASASSMDEIAIAGLERAHVEQFEGLGFPRAKVIDVLKRLNYRGANVTNISEDRIVEELLK
ncbi:hypothetical protein D9758_003499 [Tetrapyrgos nigripes]|uniref:Ubiquitin-conjugating enzyme E2 1 n=1 Tax=Tetrapyrgos nigripes TaxID=182062 RepID=A0A8H5GVE9_9AGAR|nr:hypothetical protein D9758_003499 [Tetrapyrgos nigripes]